MDIIQVENELDSELSSWETNHLPFSMVYLSFSQHIAAYILKEMSSSNKFVKGGYSW